jgi:hypothetical protein
MATEPAAKLPAATNSFGTHLSTIEMPFAPTGQNLATALPEYLMDVFQRNVLFLGLLRRRGNEEQAIVLGGVRLLTERFAAYRTARHENSAHLVNQPLRLHAAS